MKARNADPRTFFAALVLWAGFLVPGLAAGPAGEGPFLQTAIGLCEDYPEESRTLERARRDLQLLQANKLDVLRIAFGWDAIQPERGAWDWSFWDEFVPMAVDEYGIRLIPYVCYTPEWASEAKDSDDFWRRPPADDADFAAFMGQLVRRYKDRIHSWEIWNEPDNPDYWRGSAARFARLLAAGGRAVREADPRAQVVMGGLLWNLKFLEEILTDPAAMREVQVINLHNYYETWSGEPIERIPDAIGRVHDLLRVHGRDVPLWLAETGYSSFRRGDFVSDQYRAFSETEHTARQQASALFRMLSLIVGTGQVSLVAWYRINDLPETQEVIGDANNRHLGVLDRHGKPKPALAALRFFHSLVGGGFRSIDDEVRVEQAIGAPVAVRAFRLPGGRVAVAAWVRTYVPGSRGKGSSATPANPPEQRIALRFPWRLRSAAAFNELGEPLGNIAVSAMPEASRIEDLELKPERVTVVLLDLQAP